MIILTVRSIFIEPLTAAPTRSRMLILKKHLNCEIAAKAAYKNNTTLVPKTMIPISPHE
jgi:hypothetical protein